MRPILKSQSAPTVFIEHGKAKQFLIAKLGEYCSYCERPLGVADYEYIRNPSTRNIDIIVKLAKARGFFSVWYFVFVDFPAIRAALIQAFIGTDNSCFDTSNGYEPLPRFLNDGGLLLVQ